MQLQIPTMGPRGCFMALIYWQQCSDQMAADSLGVCKLRASYITLHQEDEVNVYGGILIGMLTKRP